MIKLSDITNKNSKTNKTIEGQLMDDESAVWYLPGKYKDIKCYHCGIITKPGQRRSLWESKNELSAFGKNIQEIYHIEISKERDVDFACYNCSRSITNQHKNLNERLAKIKQVQIDNQPHLKKKRVKRLSIDRKRQCMNDNTRKDQFSIKVSKKIVKFFNPIIFQS